jgi:DNA-binding winged helix-turn-helix (wHTH) protein/TolB-like protein/tetratricopeptide (TPR) repeat protein
LLRPRQQFYAFGPFLLDTARHLLTRQGEPVPLTPKSYDTLLALVEQGGNLMSKDELMQAVWPDHSVEEANLTQQISTIRKALGDSGERNQYIVTVPARGYRFAVPVRAWSDEAVQSTPPAVVPVWRRWTLRALIPILAVAVIAAIFLAMRPRAPKSLAILPFQNLTRDPNLSYLGFSLADAIITRLDYVNSLTVRPSYAVQRYRDQAVDLRSVARELRVDTLLTGSFIRDGDDLRITVQLIDVEPQKLLWRKTFDEKFDRLLIVQDKVAREIIGGLALSLSPSEGERLRKGQPVNPVAYEFYLRGVDLYARSEFATAIRMLEKSVELDGNYALTWAELGRAYTADASFQLGGREEYKKAQAAYERALALQPAEIDAQIYMANFFTDTGQVQRAVPLLRKALASNPNHAEAHWELGYAYRFAGLLNESVAESERARQLDPTVKLTTSAPNAYLYLGQYDKFLEHLPPNDDAAFLVFYRGFAAYYKKNQELAARTLDRAYEKDPALLQAAVGKAIAHGIRHEVNDGLAILRSTENKVEQRGVGDPEAIYKVAQAYAVLGDKPSALRVLRRSVEGGFFPYPYLAHDSLLDNLRAETEYAAVLTLARERYEAFRRETATAR